jgi:hypothetical protein
VLRHAQTTCRCSDKAGGRVFEPLEHPRQPPFQDRAFDLRDVPVQDEQPDVAKRVVGEKGHRRRVVVRARRPLGAQIAYGAF